MQTAARKSVFMRGKRSFLILGLVLLVSSLSLIIVYLFIIKPDTVFGELVQMTTTGDYVSPTFHVEKGDWIDFDLTSSNCSVIRLRSDEHGEVWMVDNYNPQAELNGAVYNQSLQINVTGHYVVILENRRSHCYYPYLSNYPVCVFDNNTFSGNFLQMRMPTYYPQLLISSEALLAASCGILIVPIIPYFLEKARRLGMKPGT